MVLCWLALLLVRLIETRCGGIWPQLRRELGRIAVGTFAGPVGVFRQRSEITKPLRDILARLHVDPPARMCQLAPAEAGPARTLPLDIRHPSIRARVPYVNRRIPGLSRYISCGTPAQLSCQKPLFSTSNRTLAPASSKLTPPAVAVAPIRPWLNADPRR